MLDLLTLERYAVQKPLGAGGMGLVYEAINKDSGAHVALKTLRDITPDGLYRLKREFRMLQGLEHPNVCQIYELFEHAGRWFITMELVHGSGLLDYVRGSEAKLRDAMGQLAEALCAVHEAELVHRDLKPSNVMLGNYNDVYVIDWGVARVLKARRTSSIAAVVDIDSLPPDETGVGVMLGTPGYMAPEQMKGDDVSPAADVYALGAILFEILAGEPLHPAGRPAISATLANPTDSPAKRQPTRAVPPELDEICVTALAEDPGKRPTARELAEHVQRYLDGDRDLERRRSLAVAQLAQARTLLVDPVRQIEAGQIAARALALDPESKEAAEIVSRLILEPPKELPPALVESLEESERQLNAQRGKSAMFAFLTLWALFPVFVLVQHIQNWTHMILLYATVSLMALLSWENGRTGKTPTWATMLGNFGVAFMFSRLTGSFVLTVGLVCGQTLALSSRSFLARNRHWMILWIFLALMTPVTLEWFGVLEPTWHMSSNGLFVNGTILSTTKQSDVVILALSQVALAVVVGLFAMSITRAREDAQRRAHIQAWHLQQLLPRVSTAARQRDNLASSG